MEKEKHLGLRIDAETHKKLKSLGNVILPFTQMGMCYTGKTERKPSFHSIPVKIINTWM